MKVSALAILIVLAVGQVLPASAACRVGGAVDSADDAIAVLLASVARCPSNVFEFRQLIQESGLRLETSMVANRGFHNPSRGSFSLFETVTGEVPALGVTVGAGEFFFGHFTGLDAVGEHLVLDQSPARGSLMIEAFAWDPTKGYFNFYELIGAGSQGQWFYRGDSADIVADTQLLHRQPNPSQPAFGSRLRCSGCHTAGGPIMKELAAPHNDWWEPLRKLDLGANRPDPTLFGLMKGLVPAGRFAQHVSIGNQKLQSSPGFQALKSSVSLQEKLRPLFCPVEVNFASDPVPNEAMLSNVQVPSEFFIDSRLVSPAFNPQLNVERKAYERALATLGSRFPENGAMDADHAWLTPVKAESDQLAIQALVHQGFIDEEFVLDVLAVDFANPVVSAARCGLLKFVPDHTTSADWIGGLIQNLSRAGSASARELALNLTDSGQDADAHRIQAEQYVLNRASELRHSGNVVQFVRLLNQRRNEIRNSEISKNPLGQILEPGFRVIFPELKGN